MSEYLFSYGTLQKEAVQLQLFGRKLVGVKDILQGYSICEIEIFDRSFLSKGEERYQETLVHTKDSTGAVVGTVFELTEEELMKADSYEPDNYKRVLIILASGKQAWVYMVVSPAAG